MDEIKLSVTVRKTFQEAPYEPFAVQLGLERTYKKLSSEGIVEESKKISKTLELAMDEIFVERQGRELDEGST